MKQHDFYVPDTKEKLVEWLSKFYPVNKSGIKINWHYYTLKRLQAIYIINRKRIEKEYATKKKIGVPENVTQEQLEFPFN